MNFTEYQTLSMRTRNTALTSFDSMLHGILGLVGESGEVVDLVKKHLYQGHPIDKTKLKEELGDILWSLTLTAFSLDTSLEQIAENNIEKLQKRYPDGFDAERSIQREKL